MVVQRERNIRSLTQGEECGAVCRKELNSAYALIRDQQMITFHPNVDVAERVRLVLTGKLLHRSRRHWRQFAFNWLLAQPIRGSEAQLDLVCQTPSVIRVRHDHHPLAIE